MIRNNPYLSGSNTACTFDAPLATVRTWTGKADTGKAMSYQSDEDTTPREEIAENVKSRSTWLRLVFMLIFAVIFYVSEIVMFAVAALQFLWKLFTGDVNERLTAFGANLAEFIRRIVLFLTFNSEEMPFPFTDWPDVHVGTD
jgi:hypothetical protein